MYTTFTFSFYICYFFLVKCVISLMCVCNKKFYLSIFFYIFINLRCGSWVTDLMPRFASIPERVKWKHQIVNFLDGNRTYNRSHFCGPGTRLANTVHPKKMVIKILNNYLLPAVTLQWASDYKSKSCVWHILSTGFFFYFI